VALHYKVGVAIDGAEWCRWLWIAAVRAVADLVCEELLLSSIILTHLGSGIRLLELAKS
jgi:hypothetical protein